MASSIQSQKEYEKASLAYMQGDYHKAIGITNQLVKDQPDDPTYHLLHGHVNLVLNHYQDAINEYQQVLGLTQDTTVIDNANWGMANATARLNQNNDANTIDRYYESETPEQAAYGSSNYAPAAGTDRRADAPFEIDDLGELDDPFMFGQDQYSSPPTDLQGGKTTSLQTGNGTGSNTSNSAKNSTDFDVPDDLGDLDDIDDFSLDRLDEIVNAAGMNEFNYSNNVTHMVASPSVNEGNDDREHDSDVVFMDEFDSFDDVSSFPGSSFDDSDATQMVTSADMGNFSSDEFDTAFSIADDDSTGISPQLSISGFAGGDDDTDPELLGLSIAARPIANPKVQAGEAPKKIEAVGQGSLSFLIICHCGQRH